MNANLQIVFKKLKAVMTESRQQLDETNLTLQRTVLKADSDNSNKETDAQQSGKL